jgi:hypothetical protein
MDGGELLLCDTDFVVASGEACSDSVRLVEVGSIWSAILCGIKPDVLYHDRGSLPGLIWWTVCSQQKIILPRVCYRRLPRWAFQSWANALGLDAIQVDGLSTEGAI